MWAALEAASSKGKEFMYLYWLVLLKLYFVSLTQTNKLETVKKHGINFYVHKIVFTGALT